MGDELRDVFPAAPIFPVPPPALPRLFTDLLPLLQETAAEPAEVARRVTSRNLYQHWTSDLPPPKVEFWLRDLPWRCIWCRLDALAANSAAQNVHFQLLHNVLPTPDRRQRVGVEPDAVCLACGVPAADVMHVFTACRRVAAVWARLFHRASLAAIGVLDDQQLLFLAWPGGAGTDNILVEAVTAYSAWVWETYEAAAPLNADELHQITLEAVGATDPRRRSIYR
jgi:hypothetical protein